MHPKLTETQLAELRDKLMRAAELTLRDYGLEQPHVSIVMRGAGGVLMEIGNGDSVRLLAEVLRRLT